MLNEYKNLPRKILPYLSKLKEIKEYLDQEWGTEDLVYRFYHHSFKVYRCQAHIKEIYDLFVQIAGSEDKIDKWFREICKNALSVGPFCLDHNDIWLEKTRPQVEALFHCKYFVDMLIKYTEHWATDPDSLLDSGWAAVLSLFNCR